MNEANFNKMYERAKEYKYSSMNYIDYDQCKNADILHDDDGLILLHDTSKTPSMLYFATNDFESVLKKISEISGGLRLNFVPHEYAAQLKQLGFTEWGEYIGYFNYSLADTAAKFGNVSKVEYLGKSECKIVSDVAQKCRLQSRGFEGETPESYEKWLTENEILVVRENGTIAGYCCVSIYNEGTILFIKEMAVAPDFQGKGYAKKLIEQAICHGIENGAIKGFLHVDKFNENAIDLYKKYDFVTKETSGELQMVRA